MGASEESDWMGGVRVSFLDLVNAPQSVHRQKYEDYYEGTVTLESLGVSLPPQVRVLEMVAPFPKMSIDVLSEVLNPEGYLLGDDAETPRLLRRWWQANDMDSTVKLAIVETLVQGAAYFVVGQGDGGVPRVTAHGPQGISVRYDHMGRVAEAVQQYSTGVGFGAVHYEPGLTTYYREAPTGLWEVDSAEETGASIPAIVPMVNRSRLGDRDGRSEIAEVAKLTDAASRSLTNLQVAQELLAMPTRYLFGNGLEALKDQSGNPIDKISAYFGRFLTGPEGASAGQIPGADLSQITNAYKLYAQIVSSVTGIPPSMLGITTDNPSSAEAMRVAKDRLIAKAEVKQSMFGDALEDVAKLALAFQGETPDDVEMLEMQWRDPALASVSAKAANLLQAHSQGVVSAETARDGLHLSPEQKAREDARSQQTAAMRDRLGA